MKFDFSVIKTTPDAYRGEVINVGLLVYLQNGIDIRFINSLSKLKFFMTASSVKELESTVENIEWLAKSISNADELHNMFKGFIHITKPGYFTISDNSEYEIKINNLMDKLVNPVKEKSTRTSRARITTSLKDVFKKHKIYSSDECDLFDHKVVSDYPISKDEGLFADFLLKNGAYHLTETLDLRTENNRAKLGESALKAITIDKAKLTFSNNVKSFVIYAADAKQERDSRSQLNLLSDHADKIYNINSKHDMSDYYDHILHAANDGLTIHN